jgi:hypothetical protein
MEDVYHSIGSRVVLIGQVVLHNESLNEVFKSEQIHGWKMILKR